jgi:hypothetical protein
MRGTDMTPEQLTAARNFIEGRVLLSAPPKPEAMITHRYEDLVRLVAWYGAVRYQGAQRGIGTLEAPGEAGEVLKTFLDKVESDAGV